MGSYRTSSLFHYTKEIEWVKLILKEGIKPNYTKESFIDGEVVIGIPMISFCDIPLSMADKIKSYGEYCIGFDKKWGIDEKASPILYSHKEHQIEYKMMYELHNHLKEKNDPDLDVFDFIREINSYNIFSYILGVSKPYSGNNGRHENYEENEWRIVVEEDSSEKGAIIKWLWGKCEYCKWRGNNAEKPDSKFDARKFNVSDINFIIVKDDSEIQVMVDFINDLKVFGGNSNPISEKDRALLLTKITSFDRIEKDY